MATTGAIDAAGDLPPGWAARIDALGCRDTTVGSFPRTVTHDGGTTELDAPPARVVSIEGTTSLDMLLLMGVTPVAAGGDVEGPAVADFQAALTNGRPTDPGYELITKRPEVNVEQIAAAQPDLVISQSGWIENIMEPVRAIGAPVVVFDWTEDKVDWRDNVRFVGEVVGRDACVEEIIANVEAQIDQTRAALEASGAIDDTFTVITAIDGSLAHHGADDPVGKAIVEELGLTLEPSDGAQTEFSLELAESVLRGDHILAFDFAGTAEDGSLADFLRQPTVRSVADRVVVMEPTVASAGYYPSALGLALWLEWFAGEFGA